MNLNTLLHYNPTDAIEKRFASHAMWGLLPNIPTHHQNKVEYCANYFLNYIEDLPHMIHNVITDPKVITVGLTTFALIANSFLFYPEETKNTFKRLHNTIPLPSKEQVRFAAWATTSAIILLYGMRAHGRFSNDELMNQFYQSQF